MAEGEKKSVTITEVSEHPGGFGDKKTWTVKTKEAGQIQIVQPKDLPAPKVGESVFGTLYPPKPGTSYPPSLYPSKGKGGGGNWGPRQDSPEQRRSIERQVAAKCVTQLIIAEVLQISEFRKYTDAIAGAIEGK